MQDLFFKTEKKQLFKKVVDFKTKM